MRMNAYVCALSSRPRLTLRGLFGSALLLTTLALAAPVRAQDANTPPPAQNSDKPTPPPPQTPAEKAKIKQELKDAGLTSFEGISDKEVLKYLLSFSHACCYANVYEAMNVSMDFPIPDTALIQIPRPEMKARLTRMKTTYSNPATWQNVAIHFTLAYYGVDYANTLRALLRPYAGELSLADKSPKGRIAAKQWAVLQQKAGSSLFEALALPNLLMRLYEHNHDAALLRQILAMRGIGGLAEGSSETQTTLMLNRTRAVVDALAPNPRALTSLCAFVSPLMTRQDFITAVKRADDLANDPQYANHSVAQTLSQTLKASRSGNTRVTSR